MRVSVVIPVFNAAPYLCGCLDSVLNQTLNDIEVICIDDGSTDGSGVILAERAAKDARVRVLTQANAGQGAARNRGLETAQGEYVYFMDADDELAAPDALARLAAEADRDRLDVLFFDAETRVDEGVRFRNGTVRAKYYIRLRDYSVVRTGRELFAALLENREYNVSPCLMLLRRCFVETAALRFPEARVFYEDNIFMSRVMLAAERAGHRPWRLYIRKVHEGSTVTSAPTTRHLRGYLACYMDADALVTRKGLDRRTRKLLKSRRIQYALHVVRMVRRMGLSGEELQCAMSDDERKAFSRLMNWNPILRTLTAAWCCYQDNGMTYTIRRVLFGRVEQRNECSITG